MRVCVDPLCGQVMVPVYKTITITIEIGVALYPITKMKGGFSGYLAHNLLLMRHGRKVNSCSCGPIECAGLTCARNPKPWSGRHSPGCDCRSVRGFSAVSFPSKKKLRCLDPSTRVWVRLAPKRGEAAVRLSLLESLGRSPSVFVLYGQSWECLELHEGAWAPCG